MKTLAGLQLHNEKAQQGSDNTQELDEHQSHLHDVIFYSCKTLHFQGTFHGYHTILRLEAGVMAHCSRAPAALAEKIWNPHGDSQPSSAKKAEALFCLLQVPGIHKYGAHTHMQVFKHT